MNKINQHVVLHMPNSRTSTVSVGGFSTEITPLCLNVCCRCNISAHDKTNKITCAPSEDSDQPGQLRTQSFLMRTRLRSEWADAQADLGLRWALRSFWWFFHAEAHLLRQTDFPAQSYLLKSSTT